MQYHVATCTFANAEIEIKLEKLQYDAVFPASIKWQIDQVLTNNSAQAALLFESFTTAETWIMHKCKQLWPSRDVVVTVHEI